jgi:hypothetical protein
MNTIINCDNPHVQETIRLLEEFISSLQDLKALLENSLSKKKKNDLMDIGVV